GRATLRLLGDGPATTGRTDLRRGYHRGRPELTGKPCFPAEVPSKPPELPAQNSPSFLHQIDRASEVQPTSRRNLQRAVEVCGIHHRAIHSFRASKPELKLITGNILAVGRKYLKLFDRGDSAEFSAEV
ncbi:Leucine-rich repeat family protein, partial [Prunus dulcis]